MRRARKTFVAVVIGVLAVVTAACGGDGNDGAASVSVEALQLAADNSRAFESYRFTSTIGFDIDGEHAGMQLHGLASADGTRMSVTAAIDELGSFEERIVDGIVYLDLASMPGAASGLPAGKRWISIDPAAVAGLDAEALRSLSEQAEQNTPMQGLESLQSLTGDVEHLGEDTVGGRPATHYRATIEDGTTGEDADLPEAAREALNVLGHAGRLPVDVWIDDADRVVKMQFALALPATGGRPGGRIAITMEITEFGVPVDVQAPPPEEVVPFDQVTDTGPI